LLFGRLIGRLNLLGLLGLNLGMLFAAARQPRPNQQCNRGYGEEQREPGENSSDRHGNTPCELASIQTPIAFRIPTR
jgi:hypothetical protein